jgi:hypothetical protein
MACLVPNLDREKKNTHTHTHTQPMWNKNPTRFYCKEKNK